ncbi:MAG: translocation/assembly module TamB domain-containing protein [Woeseiaceae bacterium]|nr:translocation/assembly module TamB domain-containing protein [Woeseiaceae bacterium]
MHRLLVAFAALLLLAVAGIITAWYWLLHTEGGAQFGWRQAEGALGGAMSASHVAGDISGGLVIEGFRFVDDAVVVEIERIATTAEIFLSPARVRLPQAIVSGVRVHVQPSQQESAPLSAADIIKRLRLPLVLELPDLDVTDAAVTGVGDDDIVVERLSTGVAWHDSIELSSLQVDTPRGRLRGDAALALDAPHAFDASAAVIAADDWLDAELDVNWDATSALSGTVRISRFELHRFVRQWPSASVVSGTGRIALTATGFDIEGLELQASNTGLSVTASGGVDVESAAVSGDLDWRGFQWPPISDAPVLRSDQGDVELRGSLDAWFVDGTIHVGALGVDDGEFVVAGGGDRTHAAAEIIESRVLGGTASGSVEYAWVGSQPWSATVDVQGVQIARLEGRLPGAISGGLDVRGQSVPFAVDVSLDTIKGSMRGRDFVANGRVMIADGIVTAEQLDIAHGDARFLLDGSLQTDSGLSFDAEVDDLAHYLNDASGSVAASGTLFVKQDQWYLDVDASAPFVSWRDVEIHGFNVENLDAQNVLGVVVSSDVIAIGDSEFSDSRVSIEIDPDGQSLQASTTYGDAALALGVTGAFRDWNNPDDWSGTVDELRLAVTDFPEVRLLDAAAMQASRRSGSIESLCVGTTRDATLCLSANWQADQVVEIDAEVNDLSANIVNLFRVTGFRFEQELSGEFRWRHERGRPATGFANINSSPGKITNDERPNIVLETDTGELAFDIVGGRLLEGTLRLPMPGTGRIDGHLSVVDVERGFDSAVEGRLEVDMNDISLLAVISPLVDEAAGHLRGNFDVTGTALEPNVVGDMRLDDGYLNYLPLGLQLEDVNVAAALKPDARITMTGSFRSGSGRGEVRTSSDFEYGMTSGLQIEIRGQGLQVIDLPDIAAVADVDLDLGYNGDQLNIAGRIKVPQARIVPNNLATDRVTESDDVVIVAGELPDEEVAEPESALRIFGKLAFELGDNVVVDLNVARATVTGKANLTWSGEPIPMANGRYTIDGDIQAFGQVLSVTDGYIRFPNVPANDPQLRLFAEREIYGNPQIKSAGVLVAGTLRRPTIEAFTRPATTEERALALLVTGSDFDYEQGVGAVGFGTYIAPRLFVSYGVGLFDRDNVISARYDLTEGFGIKATSGQKESGVDITYRIER